MEKDQDRDIYKERDQDDQKWLLAVLEKQLQQTKRMVRLLQILAVLTAVILVCTVAVSVQMLPRVVSLIRKGDEAMVKISSLTDRINALDLETMQDDFKLALERGADTAVDVSAAGVTIATLDVERLNSAIFALDKTASQIAEIDFSGLKTAVEKLSAAAEALTSIQILGKPLFG